MLLYIHLPNIHLPIANRRPQIELDDVAADESPIVPGEVLAETDQQRLRTVIVFDRADGNLRSRVKRAVQMLLT